MAAESYHTLDYRERDLVVLGCGDESEWTAVIVFETGDTYHAP